MTTSHAFNVLDIYEQIAVKHFANLQFIQRNDRKPNHGATN
jgi:hypothetical protein